MAPKDLLAWEADMGLEFFPFYHAMTFKCHYSKTRIKFLPVPFYILASFSELLMKPSLNSSYYVINDVDRFHHIIAVIQLVVASWGTCRENYVYLTIAEDQ